MTDFLKPKSIKHVYIYHFGGKLILSLTFFIAQEYELSFWKALINFQLKLESQGSDSIIGVHYAFLKNSYFTS